MRRTLLIIPCIVLVASAWACHRPGDDAPAPSRSTSALSADLETVCEASPSTVAIRSLDVVAAPDAAVDPRPILDECTDSGPYGPHNNCVTSANRCYTRCRKNGIGCRTATINCTDGGVGHAVNIVQMMQDGGLVWCAVDTTPGPGGPRDEPAIYEPCYADPDDLILDPDLACRIMGIDPDGGRCTCSFEQITDAPQPPTDRPDACRRQNPTDTNACLACCKADVEYYLTLLGDTPSLEGEIKKWLSACWDACQAPDAGAATPATTSKMQAN